MKKRLVIAIDGPAGSGKSTMSKLMAERLHLILVDTGAIYRALALHLHRHRINIDDAATVTSLIQEIRIHFEFKAGINRVFLNQEDVTEGIRTEEISLMASAISAKPYVRAGLLQIQKDFVDRGGVVLEGRDIGTVIAPAADYKFFLVANLEKRAERRFSENVGKGMPADVAAIKDRIEKRDKDDTERAVAPLKKAPDAIEIDTSSLSIEAVLEKMLHYVKPEPT